MLALNRSRKKKKYKPRNNYRPVREDTHKKGVFFSGRTTKRCREGKPL